MAAAILISGHTTVSINGSVLGETDDGNDIRIKVFPGRKEIHTNLSGPELFEKIINLGIRAQITVPLVKIDEAVFGTLAAGPAAAEGQNGILGADVSSVSLTITPYSGKVYAFPCVWLTDNYEIAKFGYEPKVYTLTFKAQPNLTILGASTAPTYIAT